VTRRGTICNKCGKVLDFWDRQEEFHIFGYLGYGTKYDGNIFNLNLCCKCMEEIIDACVKIPLINPASTKEIEAALKIADEEEIHNDALRGDDYVGQGNDSAGDNA